MGRTVKIVPFFMVVIGGDKRVINITFGPVFLFQLFNFDLGTADRHGPLTTLMTGASFICNVIFFAPSEICRP
jgi:hypothetical protein